MPVRSQSRPILRLFAPLWCAASTMVLWGATLLLFFITGAAIDRKDCTPVVCNSGKASLPVTGTESCGVDDDCRIQDQTKTTRAGVNKSDETVTVPCNSSVYYLMVNGQETPRACYNLTNETTPTQAFGQIQTRPTPGPSSPNKTSVANATTPTQDPNSRNQPFNLLWLLLIVPLIILVLIGVAVYLWNRLIRKLPATSYEMAPMNDAAPPAAQPKFFAFTCIYDT